MQIFVDANIYLEYFRENSGERLDPLKALLRLVKSKEIKLLLPLQTLQEYSRNRNKIVEQTRSGLLKQSRISSLIPAVIDTQNKEVKAVVSNTKKLSASYKKLIKKYDKDVESENTDADRILKSLFKLAVLFQETEVVLENAYRRYMKGNPPRKSDFSYGDAITWEILLENATNDDLVVVTRDGDYIENRKGIPTLNSYLHEEWRTKNKNKKKVRLYKSLAEFVNFFEKKNIIKEEIVNKEKSLPITQSVFPVTSTASGVSGSSYFSSPIISTGSSSSTFTVPTSGTYVVNSGTTPFYDPNLLINGSYMNTMDIISGGRVFLSILRFTGLSPG